MIHESGSDGKEDFGFLGFGAVYDLEVAELEKVLERILPGGAALVKAFFAPDAVVNVDWFAESDSARLCDVETGEVTTITNTNQLAFLRLVAVLHESRSQYEKGNVDLGWRSLVGFSHSLRGLNAQLDAIDRGDAPSREITLLRSELAAAGARGADAKHAKTRALKEWAVKNACASRASDREISRALAAKLPAEFVDVSVDPERLIYEALRATRKPKCGLPVADQP